MRLLHRPTLSIALSVALCGTLYGAKIDDKIQSTSKELSQTKQSYTSLNAKLNQTAKEIVKQKSLISTQQEKINLLMDDLKSKEDVYRANKAKLKELGKRQSNLIKTQNDIEQRLVFAIARNTSMSLVISDDRAKEANSIITEEALKIHLKQINEEIKELNDIFAQNVIIIDELNKQTSALQKTIAAIDNQKNKVLSTKKENEKAIAQLERERNEYKKSLDKILKQQKSLQSTLAQLNIIKKEAQKPKPAPKPATTTTAAKDIPADVKKVVSEYVPSNTARYSGSKTMAPLDGYTVTKKFGPYTDPIYGIKIFNDSISMRPKESDAKVKLVFNGKVVLAKPTAMLENVVIVEHDNGLHTIYAHMDKIAPTVEVGKRLKQGSIIGRVSKELMFQVTQRNAHINPLEVIH